MTTAVSPARLHPPRKPDEETDTERIYNGVSFASDAYVPWIIGSLRLGKADLSRMRTSGVPVLRSHQPDNVVGATTRVEKKDGLWRSNWRLPKIPANRDTFDQMDTGILRGISVGGNLKWESLTIDNPDETNIDDVLLTCDWMLVEQSLTAIPADTTSGVDRTAADVLARAPAIFDTVITGAGITTLETPAIRERLESLVRTHNENLALRREETMTTPAIAPDVLERAIADALGGNDVIKRLSGVPDQLDAMKSAAEQENQRNMEYRAKLDGMQYQPNGQVLQQGNWTPGDRAIDLGKILRLTALDDLGFPEVDRTDITLEESFLEQAELGKAGRNVVARIPFAALAERERQMGLQRSTLASGAGARPVDISVLGNAGLVLAAYSPILARMDVRMGVTGGQKAPWLTSQQTAAAVAEQGAITVSNPVLNNVEYLPKSIVSAFEWSSALRSVDDGTFMQVALFSISQVLLGGVTGQILTGSEAAEISGIWGTSGVVNVNYGSAQTDFDRNDALDVLNNVRLSNTDGSDAILVASKSLWQLMEKTPRGEKTYGPGATSGGGITEITRFLLDDVQRMTSGAQMGMVEGAETFYYSGLAPTGTNDPGLAFKPDRVIVWFWGDSLNLEFIPERKSGDTYKMCAEANAVYQRPSDNFSRIKRT